MHHLSIHKNIAMFQTNLMVYYPQWGALYPPDLTLHGEQIKIEVNYITQLIMLQFCDWINMSMSSYNKLIGQQVVCHDTIFILLLFQSQCAELLM